MTTHSYNLVVRWQGNRGEGTATYRSYRRHHTISGDGLPDLLGSADPTFHGDRDRWNPEQLLVAALSQCHMLSYLHVCADAGIVVQEYVDRPTGTMRTDRDGSGRFTEVMLRPRVAVAAEDQVDEAIALHAKAHQLCFIANSVSFPVRHEPTVVSL